MEDNRLRITIGGVVIMAVLAIISALTGNAKAATTTAPADVLPGYVVTDSADVAVSQTGLAAGCANHGHDFTAKSYSWTGLWQFTYHSKWQWTGCNGKVTSQYHSQRGDTAVGWSYDGFTNGNKYGCIGCSMFGRETYGHFSFLKYAIHDTADLQTQVHGDGGWWAWANVTGP